MRGLDTHWYYGVDVLPAADPPPAARVDEETPFGPDPAPLIGEDGQAVTLDDPAQGQEGQGPQ